MPADLALGPARARARRSARSSPCSPASRRRGAAEPELPRKEKTVSESTGSRRAPAAAPPRRRPRPSARPPPRRPPTRSTSPTSRRSSCAWPRSLAAEKIAGLEEAPEAPGRPRRREAADRGRHRRVAYAPEALVGQEDRDRRQPQAREAHGRRVERHGARRAPSTARPSCCTFDADVAPGHEGQVAICAMKRRLRATLARAERWPAASRALRAGRARSVGCPARPRGRLRPGRARRRRRALVVARGAALRHARGRAATRPTASTARPRAPRASRFLWSKGEAEVALRFDQRRARAPRSSTSRPSAACAARRLEVRLNGAARRDDSRSTTPAHRYRFALPAAAQKAGRQPPALRLRARRPSPRDGDPKSAGPAAARGRVLQPRRRRGATMPGSRTCSRRDAPGRSRSRTRKACPSLALVGPTRRALRDPAARGRPSCASRPTLHRAARGRGRRPRRSA